MICKDDSKITPVYIRKNSFVRLRDNRKPSRMSLDRNRKEQNEIKHRHVHSDNSNTTSPKIDGTGK